MSSIALDVNAIRKHFVFPGTGVKGRIKKDAKAEQKGANLVK